MTAEKLISDNIPFVLESDSVSSVLKLMSDTHIPQLPMIDNDRYMGLVDEEALLNVENTEITLTSTKIQWLQPAVLASVHPYDAIKIISKFSLQTLPVIDNEGAYLGAISKNSVVDYVAEYEAINESGGILVLEMNAKDYSLAEIARICESNEVTILNSSVYSNKETQKLEVTLKLNKSDLQYVMATFDRYDYNVINAYGDHTLADSMSDRYDLLMNYLNM